MNRSFNRAHKAVSTFLVAILLLTTSSCGVDGSAGDRSRDDEIAQLTPYMQITHDRLLVLDQERIPSSLGVSQETIEWVQDEFAGINARAKEGLSRPEPGVCVHVPRWVLDTIAWTAIIYGAGITTIGLFASGTIVGIPVGAILGAVGLWDGVAGSLMLWWVDVYYPNGLPVCW